MTNKIKVNIVGRDYTLITENEPEYTKDLALRLDSKMKQMLAGKGSLNGIDAAILCALDAMDEAENARTNADNIRFQLGEYMTSADKAKQRFDASKKEIANLKKKIAELEVKLKDE